LNGTLDGWSITSMVNIAAFIDKNALAGRRKLWRLVNGRSPDSRAIYILGAQRSGTTLLLDCLQRSMEFEVLGESSRAMERYRIKSDDYIVSSVLRSHHRFVVFKPLTDSHRARAFLGLFPNSKAVWAFRRVEDRVNSSIARFGDINLRILRELSRGEGLEKWQAQGLSDDDFSFIRGFDYTSMSPHTASALFWYVRNSLFFSQGLQDLESVLPLAYEDFVSSPDEMMKNFCRFVGAEFRPEMIARVHAQSIGRARSQLSNEIVALCQPMYERLRTIQQKRLGLLAVAT
jgi:hypothetical protein